jgi:nucleoside-diphosphate kinase
MLQRTLTFIKPDAMNEGHIGEIVSMIETAGFRLVAAKIQSFTKDDAARFYEVHRGKDFFEGLIEYASSGPILAFVSKRKMLSRIYEVLSG